MLCPARTRGTSPSCLPRPTPQADKSRGLSVPWSPRVWLVLLLPTHFATHSPPCRQEYMGYEYSRFFTVQLGLSRLHGAGRAWGDGDASVANQTAPGRHHQGESVTGRGRPYCPLCPCVARKAARRAESFSASHVRA